MKVSILVCTYQRVEAAKNLLSRLQRQTYKDFEVLVVSQGSKDDFEKIKDSAGYTYPIRYYYEASPNVGYAKNIGIRQAQGEIIVFLDDDVVPQDKLLEAHITNYVSSDVGIVGGRVLGDKRHQEDVPASKIGMVRKIDGYAYAGHHKDVKRDVMHVKAGNMSVRKDVAREVGGCDERFEGTAEYEELDFCLRVFKKGYKIRFDPKAIVEHLALSFGGATVDGKEEGIYWLYRNHSLVFLNNLNKFFYPVLLAEYIIRIIRRSLLWRNPKVILSGLRGIRDGWRAHFYTPRRGLEAVSQKNSPY